MILIDQIPNKSLFKVQEVCELCQIKPYVLRFWDSEFDQIQSVVNSSGKKLYQKRDILIISVLKDLLFERKLTIEKARHELSSVDFEKIVAQQAVKMHKEKEDNLSQVEGLSIEQEINTQCSDEDTSKQSTENISLESHELSFEDQEKARLARLKLEETLDFIGALKRKYNWA